MASRSPKRGAYVLMIDKDFFSENGFVVAKGVFLPASIEDLRDRLRRSKARAIREGAIFSVESAKDATFIQGDLLGQLELADVAYLVLDERLITCVRHLIGDKITYFGD